MIRLADRFLLEFEIGSGGMARVFLGRDEVLDRPVAVKILKSGLDGSDVSARFRREGRTSARLSHPNIVQVYDAGEDKFEGRLSSYIVMEYLSGGDLKGLLDERGSLSGGRLASLGADVASGLAHAHDRGIVHRDVKPHNILLDDHGRPKLADFGIARALNATTSNRTRTGSYLGTAVYSSPEQLQGERVTPKSDVYSLGATLYQAATGQPLFTGSPIEVASQHVTQPPKPPGELGAAIGKGLEDVILACLDKDPDARPTAIETRDRLEELEGETGDSPANPPQATPRATPQATPQDAPLAASESGTRRSPGVAAHRATFRRRRLRWSLLALLVVLLIAAVSVPRLLTSLDSPEERGDVASQNGPPAGDSRDQADAEQADQTVQEGASPGTTMDRTEPRTTREQTKESTGPGALTRESAARAVEEFYDSAATGDYDKSSEFLSSGYRRSEFPSESVFEGTFGTLQSVRFVEGPEVRVSGETATATGVTIARHSDRTERNAGTWTLVDEGGRWRISQISVGASS